jgi:hypothetical protein
MMIARWLMALCGLVCVLFLSEDARGYELLPQRGLASLTTASGQSGFAELTLSRQSTAKMGDSFRLFTDHGKPLRLGMFDETRWEIEPEDHSEDVQAASGPPPQDIPLGMRLLWGVLDYVKGIVCFDFIFSPVFFLNPCFVLYAVAGFAVNSALSSNSVAISVLSFGVLFSVAAAIVLGVSWYVWAEGNKRGGDGSYLATVVGMMLSLALLAGVTWLDFADASEGTRMWSVIAIPVFVASFFGPVAGYEISSHNRRQRRNYSVGISPVFAPGPASSMRVEGAALAIRGAF